MSASRTAQYVALYRALETTEMRRAPLFRDPFARHFLSPNLRLAERLARLRPARALLEWYADRRAKPWTFGLEPADTAPFLARFGLALEEDLGADQYRARYLGTASRLLRGYTFYRVAVARVAPQ